MTWDSGSWASIGQVALPDPALHYALPLRADRRQQLAGKHGRADKDIRQRRVRLVVLQLRAVDSRAVQSASLGDGHRGGRVPFMLAAAVHISIGSPSYPRGGLRAGRAERHELGSELVGERH